VHGTDDPTNPFPGDDSPRWGYSVERAAARWASLDRCDASPALEKVSEHVSRLRYATCSGASEVVLYRIEAPRDQGGGHVWPGSQRDLATRAPSASSAAPSASDATASGPPTQTEARRAAKPAVEVDATAVVLDFFSRH
jgi:poly(3-hydroxybutyrate) depolymerase